MPLQCNYYVPFNTQHVSISPPRYCYQQPSHHPVCAPASVFSLLTFSWLRVNLTRESLRIKRRRAQSIRLITWRMGINITSIIMDRALRLKEEKEKKEKKRLVSVLLSHTETMFHFPTHTQRLIWLFLIDTNWRKWVKQQ